MSLLIDEKMDLTLQEWTSYAVLLGEALNTLRVKKIFWATLEEFSKQVDIICLNNLSTVANIDPMTILKRDFSLKP